MKALHGGKAKNDKIDAHKIAVLLRGGMFPQAYVYPPEMRATRDLLRRRCHLARKRAELLAPIHHPNSQDNLPKSGKRLANKANREDVAAHFPDPCVRKTIEVDVSLIDHYDQLLGEVELYITRSAKAHDVQTFSRLQSVPDIGQILALVILLWFIDAHRSSLPFKELSGRKLGLCLLENVGCFLYCLDDILVPGATAEVTGNPPANLFLAWARVLTQQLVDREDHSGRAEATLEGMMIDKSLLNRM